MAESPVDNPFQASQRAHRLRNILYISLGGLALLGLIVFYSLSRRSSILLTGLPEDAIVTLNGKGITTKKTDKGVVVPAYTGIYRLRIERPNYLPFQTDVRVN